MGLAIDTPASFVSDATTLTLTTISPGGDSFGVRNFASTDQAFLMNIIRGSATAGPARITSPLLHDNVTGLTVNSGENPSIFTLPSQAGQLLQSNDTLAVYGQGGGSELSIVAWSVYYTNLPGASARLHSWGDISGIVKYIKPMPVALTTSATVGTWVDTLITTTENQLHADADYAVLGYLVEPTVSVVAVKGGETGNLRAGGPGSTSSYPTDTYFVDLSNRTGRPCIPVFNANNRNGFYVSAVHAVASIATTVTLILAQLTNTITP